MPTKMEIDCRDLHKEIEIPETQLCLRIANARIDFNNEIKEHNLYNGSSPQEYEIPEIHLDRSNDQ